MWCPYWSMTQQREYYWNHETAEVRWDAPESQLTVAQAYDSIAQGQGEETVSPEVQAIRHANNRVKRGLIERSLQALGRNNNRSGVRVLDVCCGKGGDIHKWMRAESAHVEYYHGIDISSHSIAEARRRALSYPDRDTAFDAMDVRLSNWPIAESSFDVVSCQMALHYMCSTEDLLHEFFCNIYNVLRPGGIFVASFPDEDKVLHQLYNSRVESSACNLTPLVPLHEGPLPYVFRLDGSVPDVVEFTVPNDLLDDCEEMLDEDQCMFIRQEQENFNQCLTHGWNEVSGLYTTYIARKVNAS